MKISKSITVSTIAIIISCMGSVLPCSAATDGAIEAAAGKPPLNNRELHQLRLELSQGGHGHGENVSKRIKGTEVKVTVKLFIRPDKTVTCTVLDPDKNGSLYCLANLAGFELHNLKHGEIYLLEGMIVEDRIDFGAFWIYASRLTRAEQTEAEQPAIAPESKPQGSPRPKSEPKGFAQ